jgi:hypothetical protein
VILTVVFALLFLSGATLIVDRVTPRFLTSAAWLVLLMFGTVGAVYDRPHFVDSTKNGRS